MRYIILTLLCAVLICGGCQSSRKLTYNPGTGEIIWESKGDFVTNDLAIDHPALGMITLGSSKSQDAAYREGIQAARDVMLKALDGLAVGK